MFVYIPPVEYLVVLLYNFTDIIRNRKKKTMSYTFFFRPQSPFSNWNQNGETFTLYGQTFNCGEQAMMWCKAWLFGDMEKASEILASEYPKEQKALGREVGGYDETMWQAMRVQVMYMVLKAKFTQVRFCYDKLMSTGTTKMVEASPYDKLWGNGLSEEKSRMIPESQWPGKNLLGKVMTRLKGDIFHNAMSDFTLDEILQIGIKAKQEKS
jgi:hypothetical protein